MISAFLISLPALQGGVSVLDQVGDLPPESTSPMAPAVIDGDANTEALQPDANTSEQPVGDANASPAEPPATNADAPAGN